MGLDQYAFSVQKTRIILEVDIDSEVFCGEALHCWRKHPDLHGWMQRLYKAKGGLDPEFNLSAVHLNTSDLNRLESSILQRKLPKTGGFFFGESDGTEYADDLDFVAKARLAINNGLAVFYIAWW